MFTKLFNSIRDSITRGPNQVTSNNDTRQENNPSPEFHRRPSVAEEIQNNDTHSVFSSGSQSLPSDQLGRNHSISVSRPIAINDNKMGGKPRRESTLFGISNVTADDYVQKDLISNSWS